LFARTYVRRGPTLHVRTPGATLRAVSGGLGVGRGRSRLGLGCSRRLTLGAVCSSLVCVFSVPLSSIYPLSVLCGSVLRLCVLCAALCAVLCCVVCRVAIVPSASASARTFACIRMLAPMRLCARLGLGCCGCVRAPAPTPPTYAKPCADLAPTLPPTAANWRRTPWLALPCAVCVDRRQPPPTAADRRPAPTGRPRPAPAVAEPDAAGSTASAPRSAAPSAARSHTTSDAGLAEVSAKVKGKVCMCRKMSP
jgi:hypothetical protein